MTETYVLDTHVLIWYFVGSDQLRSRQKEKITETHDRIIAATASFYESGVVTKDEVIEDSGEIETL